MNQQAMFRAVRAAADMQVNIINAYELTNGKRAPADMIGLLRTELAEDMATLLAFVEELEL